MSTARLAETKVTFLRSYRILSVLSFGGAIGASLDVCMVIRFVSIFAAAEVAEVKCFPTLSFR